MSGGPEALSERQNTVSVAALSKPVAEELHATCERLDVELRSELPLVHELCQHVRHYRGKMLRPTLLLLCGKATGQITETHITLAAVVEIVHLSTLVHDDVLDEADLRRRQPTINRLQGNEAAVLLGDYLISHAFHLCSSLSCNHAARIIGVTTNTICEGELTQVMQRGNFNLTREQYLDIITRKTAVLLGTCCTLGAHYGGADAETTRALTDYGRDIGIAFQIIDDTLDIVGNEQRMGKTLGLDWAKSKITLPVIHHLTEAGDGNGGAMAELLREKSPNRERLQSLLNSTGSIEYAIEEAGRYVARAVDRLAILPDTPARQSLIRAAQLTIERQD